MSTNQELLEKEVNEQFKEFLNTKGLTAKFKLAFENMKESCKEQHEKEHIPVEQAAINGAYMRFRAIMMTAISSLLGFLPLVTAVGAGAMARRAIGSSIFGGMAVASFIGIFFIPSLYVLFQKITEYFWGERRDVSFDVLVPTKTEKNVLKNNKRK